MENLPLWQQILSAIGFIAMIGLGARIMWEKTSIKKKGFLYVQKAFLFIQSP